MGLIDALAHHYGWSKHQILNEVYFDEAIDYIDLIKRRGIINNLTQLAIVSNPHTRQPKELYETLRLELRKLEKRTMIDVMPEKGAFDKLRGILNKK